MGPEQNFFWLVGLLEGEGSFMSPPPSRPNEPRVEIEMTDADTMARVSALLGVKMQRRTRQGKEIYRARVAGKRAVQIMQDVRPYVCARRKAQIDRALGLYTLPSSVASLEQLGHFPFASLCEEPMCPERVAPLHQHGQPHRHLALAA